MNDRKSLRLLAPLLALLVLTACSDKKQASEFYQQFADQQQPGVGGAIKDATGLNGNTPEVQAAIDAGQGPIKRMEGEDKVRERLDKARHDGNKQEAEWTLNELLPFESQDDVELQAFRNGVQLGLPDLARRYHAVQATCDQYTKVVFGANSIEQETWTYFDNAIDETNKALHDIDRMAGLTTRERHARQQYAAWALSDLYRRRAKLEEHFSFSDEMRADENAAAQYETMWKQLGPEQ